MNHQFERDRKKSAEARALRAAEEKARRIKEREAVLAKRRANVAAIEAAEAAKAAEEARLAEDMKAFRKLAVKPAGGFEASAAGVTEPAQGKVETEWLRPTDGYRPLPELTQELVDAALAEEVHGLEAYIPEEVTDVGTGDGEDTALAGGLEPEEDDDGEK